jgi:hypothetical protein
MFGGIRPCSMAFDDACYTRSRLEMSNLLTISDIIENKKDTLHLA